MKKNTERLDSLTEHLRKRAPEIKHPELLTDSILNRIQHQTSKSETQLREIHPKLYWLRTASSIAASFLIGLFLVQQFVFKMDSGESATNQTTTIHITSLKNNSIINRQTLRCQLLENTSKNVKFRNLLSSKNQSK